MINAIHVQSGFAHKLFGERTFDFSPGLNIVYGPNGSGKTTLLKLLAAYTFSQKGGWTSLPSSRYDLLGHMTLGSTYSIPQDIEMNGCKAFVDWDGVSVYYQNTAIMDAPISQFGMTGLDMVEEIQTLLSHPSEGQRRLGNIERLLKDTSKIPDLLKQTGRISEAGQALLDYVKNLPRDGKPTIIYDEPDRSLSIANQAMLWTGIPDQARHFQVIVATHSPLLSIRIPSDAHFIEICPGCFDEGKRILEMYREAKSYKEIAEIIAQFHKEEHHA